MEPKHLTSVERMTMILAGIVIAAGAIAAPRRVAFGITVGAALMVANAWVMRRVGRKVMKASRPGAAILLLNLKMLTLVGLVFLVLHFLPIDAIGFLIGVSIFPVAILVAAVRNGMAESSNETAETPSHGER